MLGFIAVKLPVRDKEGQIHKTNECLYFAEHPGISENLEELEMCPRTMAPTRSTGVWPDREG